MKVISEYKLDKEQIKEYRNKNYEVYYGYEKYSIKPGESVGILIDNMYTSTINLIEGLLHRKTKSRITIKYKEKTYSISTPDEWLFKYYDDKKRRWCRIIHPILEEYYLKRNEYNEQKEITKAKEITNTLLEHLDNKIPEDLDNLLSTFAPLYDIQIDYNNLESKLRAYMSIKYYLDNEVEYSKDILGHTPDEEPMFETISFGNERYLEDMLYKNNEVY